MKLAYVTTYDASDVRNWSGLGYYMAKALEAAAIPLDYLGSLQDSVSHIAKLKRRIYAQLLRKNYLLDRDPALLKSYAIQVAEKLRYSSADIVFSPGTIPIAFLDCEQPIVFWTDCTFDGMIDFYPHFSNLCQETIRQGHAMEKAALERCKLAIYSSEWAAKSAIESYQANPDKVKVVPFGANLSVAPTQEEVAALIKARSSDCCQLLFLGVDWIRKGGDVALEVAKLLNQAGLTTQLTIVGCQPIVNEPLPDFVKVIPYINKSNADDASRLNQLLTTSHFLILPSLADCTPVVFSEANALAVPVLSTDVGGIPSVITADVNGKTFSTQASPAEYCDYITDLFANYSRYQQLCFSSFNEYQTRLNWTVAAETVKDLLRNTV